MSGLKLVNEALVRIGVSPLASLEDLSAQALTSTHIYEETRERCLSEHPWSFSLREVDLAQLDLSAETPDFLQYKYAYQLPADCLRVLGFWNRAFFMIAGARLFTNEQGVNLLYIRRTDPAMWSPSFRKWVVLELAAAFTVTLTDDHRRAEVFYTEARTQRSIAKSIDSQQTPSYVFDMLRVYTETQGNYLGG